MKISAYDWVKNLEEHSSTNLGLAGKAKSKFNSVDSIGNISTLSSTQIRNIIHSGIEETLGNLAKQVEVKDIQLRFRHESEHGHTDAGNMSLITKRFDKDSIVSLLVMGGQYIKMKMMCISLAVGEKMTDTWKRNVKRANLIPKGKVNLFYTDHPKNDKEYEDSFLLTLDIDGRNETLGVKLSDEYGHWNLSSGYFLFDDIGEFNEYLSTALEMFKLRVQAKESELKAQEFSDTNFTEVN